jgi:hypothetical protein
LVINRKALASLLVALGVALGVFGLLIPDAGTVAAQATPSATRSLSSSSVAPGAEITVTVTASDFGQFGGIIETLPEGFAYVDGSGSPTPRVSGQTLTFTLFGVSSVSYTVTASDTAGDYSFSGVVKDDQGADHPFTNSTVTVVADDTGDGTDGTATTTPPVPDGDPTATRSLSAMSVAQGGEVVVTIEASNYGQFGGVVETLPAGFTYVTSDLSTASASGQTVRFTLLNESSFTYTVTASDTSGTYTFSGVLRDDQGTDHPIADSTITVEPPVPPSATRSFPSEYVAPLGELVVTIEPSNYGQFGGVVETLPAGFTYMFSDLSTAVASGQTVRFPAARRSGSH